MKNKIIIILLLFLVVNSYLYSQDSLKDKEKLENLEAIKRDINSLKDKQENNIELTNNVLIFLGILLAIGFGSSLIFSVKSEIKNGKLFNDYKTDRDNQEQRSNELYKMFLQDRENEKNTIETTEKTIALVNRTLELAVQASERSAKSLQIRLKNILQQIEKESADLIKKCRAFEDDKNLTSKKQTQNEIHRIGNKIEGLENNLVILDQEGLDDSQVIKLTPYSKFIKGANQYLNEQFDDAISIWTELLDEEIKGADSDKLKSLTYYWIGYVNNNLAHFDEGNRYFLEAEKLTKNSRKYELQRMQIETRFFNNESPTSISKDFEKLLEEIDTDTKLSDSQKHTRKSKVLNTLGNVYYLIFKQSKTTKDKEKYLLKSKNTFLKVLNINDDKDILNVVSQMDNDSKDNQKWVLYGLAESMYHIDEENKKIAIELFEKEIIKLAESEYENREEKRTKVLAKTCQLLCSYRINPKDKEKLENLRAMIEIPLSDLNNRLTIYSQLVRKNIEYTEFKKQLKQIIDHKI